MRRWLLGVDRRGVSVRSRRVRRAQGVPGDPPGQRGVGRVSRRTRAVEPFADRLFTGSRRWPISGRRTGVRNSTGPICRNTPGYTSLSEDERKKREEIQAASTADFTEFIFYAYIPEKSSNDFDRRGSIWTIFLIDTSGARIDPVEVKRIEPVTAVITEFFPYVNPYHGNCISAPVSPADRTGAGTPETGLRQCHRDRGAGIRAAVTTPRTPGEARFTAREPVRR